ncbi:hypothetical protein TNCV_2678851 [Trichonephila clavipes]|nr:hypothetical protein TNCV_2678851 [Trichonephila clavipes]
MHRPGDKLRINHHTNHGSFLKFAPGSTPSLHLPTTNQVVPSPPRTATPSGTINNYDMGWRLALRAICPATDSCCWMPVSMAL